MYEQIRLTNIKENTIDFCLSQFMKVEFVLL